MKKSQQNILKLAYKFNNKYAQSQNLQQIIENAASYGEKSDNGIMNFPAQLQKDQASLSINVTVDSKSFGRFRVDVSQPVVDPPQFAPNYTKLSEQIKKYLEKHIYDFPQVNYGTTTLRWPVNAGSGVAQN